SGVGVAAVTDGRSVSAVAAKSARIDLVGVGGQGSLNEGFGVAAVADAGVAALAGQASADTAIAAKPDGKQQNVRGVQRTIGSDVHECRAATAIATRATGHAGAAISSKAFRVQRSVACRCAAARHTEGNVTASAFAAGAAGAV